MTPAELLHLGSSVRASALSRYCVRWRAKRVSARPNNSSDGFEPVWHRTAAAAFLRECTHARRLLPGDREWQICDLTTHIDYGPMVWSDIHEGAELPYGRYLAMDARGVWQYLDD